MSHTQDRQDMRCRRWRLEPFGVVKHVGVLPGNDEIGRQGRVESCERSRCIGSRSIWPPRARRLRMDKAPSETADMPDTFAQGVAGSAEKLHDVAAALQHVPRQIRELATCKQRSQNFLISCEMGGTLIPGRGLGTPIDVALEHGIPPIEQRDVILGNTHHGCIGCRGQRLANIEAPEAGAESSVVLRSAAQGLFGNSDHRRIQSTKGRTEITRHDDVRVDPDRLRRA